MSDNALDERPLVREAYAELAAEIERQYSYLPVRIELWTDENSQPYENSKAMQRDVMENNHTWTIHSCRRKIDSKNPNKTCKSIFLKSGVLERRV